MNIKTKSIIFSLASASIALGLSLQPASAQERGRSRFNFAPNYYRLESSSPPPVSYHPIAHSVSNGHVPNSKSLLGLDPGTLPVAPPKVETQTQATLTQATPNAHYKESFGAPANAPVMAALPATALNLPKDHEKAFSANKSVSGKLLNKKVSGKLLKKHMTGNSGQALALGPVASYGKNFGYKAGPTTPSAYGSGMTVNTAVSGKLLHKIGR